jgi:hypothetical protein
VSLAAVARVRRPSPDRFRIFSIAIGCVTGCSSGGFAVADFEAGPPWSAAADGGTSTGSPAVDGSVGEDREPDDESLPPNSDGGAGDGVPADGVPAGDATATIGDAGDATAPVAAATACAAWATAYCARKKECLRGLYERQDRGEADCVAKAFGSATCAELIAAHGSGLQPARIASCAAALETASCKRFEDHVYGRPLPACAASGGTLADSAVCWTDWQCASGRCTVDATSRDACGRCATRDPKASCTLDAQCPGGQFCMGTCSSDWVEVDDTCDSTRRCAGDAFCNGGRCTLPGIAGAACTGASCSSAKGFSCSIKTKTCIRQILSSVGGNCSIADSAGGPEAVPVCPGGLYCELRATSTTGIRACRVLPSAGSECGEGGRCLFPDRCVDGICRTPRPAANCK